MDGRVATNVHVCMEKKKSYRSSARTHPWFIHLEPVALALHKFKLSLVLTQVFIIEIKTGCTSQPTSYREISYY